MSELIVQDGVSGVYRLLNTLNRHFYIGSSVNMRVRWLDHIAELNSNKHANRYLSAAWRKWGSGAFVFEIVETCDRNDLPSRERWWIDRFSKELGWDMLYNLSRDPSAPMRGLKHSDEARAKIKAATSLPRNGRCRDWKHSPEWLAKMVGRKLSEEHRKKIGRAHLGQKRSENARLAMSAARRRTVARKKGNQLCLNLPL